MLVTLLPMLREVMLLHPSNAEFPMLVTLLGIINAPVKPLQSLNALSPMLVTLSGIVNAVNFSQ